MLTRSLLIALTLTLVAALPLYFLSRTEFTLTPANLPLLLVPLFALLGAGNYFAARAPSVGEPRAPGSTDERESGSVKWFNANKGFGFITRDSGDDIFVHFRAIRGEGRRVLRDGQRVEFAVVESKKGLQAEDVAVAG